VKFRRSAALEALIAALAQPLVAPGDPTSVAKQKLEAVHGHPIAPETAVTWSERSGVRRARVATPESRADRVLFLCHGGAFIAAGGDGYLFYAEMLARHCGARVVLVDYRLAPEHRFPAALDDLVVAWQDEVEAGLDPVRAAFIGDSCGGGLAVAALVRLRDAGTPLPAGAITLGGWFDLEASGEAATRPLGRDPFAHAEFVRARARDYLGEGGDPRNPLASPVHADLAGLPPLLLQVGQVDLTRDDAMRLAERAGRAGVDVTLEIHPGCIHGFQGLAGAAIPEAVEALRRVRLWIDARMDVSGAG
jgi:monoterpene epsilon-lactone hydrolase